jgi:hypothetical protein
MRRIIADIPRIVLVSIGVILVSLGALAALVPLLGGALDAAVVDNARLKTAVEKTTRDIAQAKTDQVYVKENLAAFETLIKSDKLIPHTRRAAVLEFNNVGRQRGLTALSYNFDMAKGNSVKALESQPKSGGYNVSVENIELRVGAPLDGNIYRFIADISDTFPGSIIVNGFELKRPPEITPLALEMVSRGQDSQLVTGTIKVSWRTAQADDKKAEAGK